MDSDGSSVPVSFILTEILFIVCLWFFSFNSDLIEGSYNPVIWAFEAPIPSALLPLMEGTGTEHKRGLANPPSDFSDVFLKFLIGRPSKIISKNKKEK